MHDDSALSASSYRSSVTREEWDTFCERINGVERALQVVANAQDREFSNLAIQCDDIKGMFV